MAQSRTEDFKRLADAGVITGRETRGLFDRLRRPKRQRPLAAQLRGPAVRRA
jgi:hypothetical protein